jgi:predicted RNA-binding Zn-ribbon protein involved in translation (DUF1610 family)
MMQAFLFCPQCHKQHIDEGEFATRVHRTHRCVDDAAGSGCGFEWRVEPAVFGVLTLNAISPVVPVAESVAGKLLRRKAEFWDRACAQWKEMGASNTSDLIFFAEAFSGLYDESVSMPKAMGVMRDMVMAEEILPGNWIITLSCGHETASSEKKVAYPCVHCPL